MQNGVIFLLNDWIRQYADGAADHTEIRAQQAFNRAVTLVGGNLVNNTRTRTGGVCARVYKNGLWGFASKGEYDEASVRAVLETAKENALFMDRKLCAGKAPLLAAAPVHYETDLVFRDVEQKTLIDYATAIDHYIQTKYPDLASRSVGVRSGCIEKLLHTDNGSFAHQLFPRTYFIISMTAETADGETVELFDIVGGGAGSFSDFYDDPMQYADRIDSLYEELMQKREGVFPNAGMCDCIIGSAVAGMVAHEAVGHTVEADLVLAGSVAASNLGKEVASPIVNMVDFAHTALGEETPLPVYVDDEGTACEDAILIKDGILVGYMNNLESAQHFGVKPCGNARAYGFADEPLVRMRNTAVLPGTDKLEDMIASIENGYYLTRTANGQADTTGEFMFGVCMGYEIKNGKLGRALRDTTISGVAFNMLKTVDMLSDTIEWDFAGFCGKKQPMPVSMGGPAIKCRVNIGGR
ncbi:MAG: TldD/PmbA family protein [Clostridia bacterium]|nr:TldD/PmbA family protein [Clostridia bacterium]